MSKIPQFEVTAWFDSHGHKSVHDLGMTARSVSINDLINISENGAKTKEALSFNDIKLSYNEPMRGGDVLRENLAALYSARMQGVTKDHILIANGGIDANNIVLSTLVGPGDHIICHYPTYQQLYQTPRSLGAEVSLWRAEPTKKWLLETDELRAMIKDNTKLIIINNPHNPSGAIISKSQLEAIIEIAEAKGITVMCDEVFRPVFHSILPSNDDFPPSLLNLGYKKVIVTGSMSKAYGLPGVRVGWIASRNAELIDACLTMRYYTTTTVSQLDEAIAAEVLSDRCIHAVLGQSIKNCKSNIEQFQNFIDEHSWACSWTRPLAGTTAMIKFHKMGKPVNDEEFCSRLLNQAGVMMVPASKCFGDSAEFQGYVRIGVIADPAEIKSGLAALTKFMEEEYEDVPTVKKR